MTSTMQALYGREKTNSYRNGSRHCWSGLDLVALFSYEPEVSVASEAERKDGEQVPQRHVRLCAHLGRCATGHYHLEVIHDCRCASGRASCMFPRLLSFDILILNTTRHSEERMCD